MQGNEAILNYFSETEAGEIDHLYEAKMLILGEGGAGKTSLLRRLFKPDEPLPEECDTTKGIDIYYHEFTLQNGRTFRLNVWDFGGQEIYHATHQFFLTHRSLYLLVDDTRKDHKSVSDEGFKYWLALIDLFGGHSPTLIFQNEKGGRSKEIDLAGIKGRYDNVRECYKGNLQQPDAALPLLKAIEFHAENLSHIGEALPAKWIAVREEIEQLAGQKAYILQNDYFAIYAQHMEFDRTKALHLSRYLHDLGVFLHFQDDPLLCRTVILQNTWATEAVFKVLDNESVKAKRGRFTKADYQELWQRADYVDMQPELLALMKKFELCYELADAQPTAWLATQLLPAARPDAMQNWVHTDDLVLRYRYDFMPKGIISRLIVRMHRFVPNPEMAWITGGLFQHDSSQLLAELLADGDEIELRARGPEAKALLSVISSDLDALNNSFSGLQNKVGKRIPCICSECKGSTTPEFYEHKKLLRKKEHGKSTEECPRSYDDVNVIELLEGIRVDTPPNWANENQRTIRIFLASSAELKEERDEFDLYFHQQNDRLIKQGYYLEIHRWENFLDAMSDTRLQDEYNKAVKACDIFVSLFFTKTGQYTEEEFDTAHQQFKATNKPLIYTFFKGAEINTKNITDEINSLLKFKDKLKELGHFYTEYDNVEHLKRQFKDQLEKLFDDDYFV